MKEISFITKFLVGIAIVMTIFVLLVYNYSINSYSKDYTKVESFLKTELVKIDTVGIMKENNKADIIQQVTNITGCSEVEVSGTTTEVKPGDTIFLQAKIIHKNLRGGIISSKLITVKQLKN